MASDAENVSLCHVKVGWIFTKMEHKSMNMRLRYHVTAVWFHTSLSGRLIFVAITFTKCVYSNMQLPII